MSCANPAEAARRRPTLRNTGESTLHFRLLAIVALAAALIGAPPASAQTVEFRGGGYISDIRGCEPVFGPGRQYVNVRFRPPGLGSNDNVSRLSLLYPPATFVFLLRGGSFGNAFQVAEGHVAGIDPIQFDVSPWVRFDTQVPRRIRMNTEELYITGFVRRYAGLPDCSMRFEFALLRH